MKILILIIALAFAVSLSYSQDKINKLLKVGDRDEYNNTITYTHCNVAYYSWVPVAAQISVDNKTKKVNLLVKLYYKGSSWVFFDKVLFKYTADDGSEKEFSISVNLQEKEKMVTSDAYVIETVKIVPSEELITNLKQFAAACNGIIRFDGKSYDNVKAAKLYLKPFLETILIYEQMRN